LHPAPGVLHRPTGWAEAAGPPGGRLGRSASREIVQVDGGAALQGDDLAGSEGPSDSQVAVCHESEAVVVVARQRLERLGVVYDAGDALGAGELHKRRRIPLPQVRAVPYGLESTGLVHWGCDGLLVLGNRLPVRSTHQEQMASVASAEGGLGADLAQHVAHRLPLVQRVHASEKRSPKPARGRTP
jgi:hypothetical protein